MLKMKRTIFWDVTRGILYKSSHVLEACAASIIRVEDRRGKQLVLILFSLIFDPEDEAIYSSETSANIYKTIRCHNPEDSTILILICFINGNEDWFLEDISEYSSENKNFISCEIKCNSVPCFSRILCFGFGCQFYCSHIVLSFTEYFRCPTS
jgi:hypothetical protein